MRTQGANIRPATLVTRIAERQGGVASWWQLRAAGLHPSAIRRCVADGILRPLHRGVYALAHRHLDRSALQRAGGLAVGLPGAVSHADAASAWAFARSPNRTRAPDAAWANRTQTAARHHAASRPAAAGGLGDARRHATDHAATHPDRSRGPIGAAGPRARARRSALPRTRVGPYPGRRIAAQSRPPGVAEPQSAPPSSRAGLDPDRDRARRTCPGAIASRRPASRPVPGPDRHMDVPRNGPRMRCATRTSDGVATRWCASARTRRTASRDRQWSG